MNQWQVREAMTALAASPLIQKQIDKVITETQLAMSPLVAALPDRKITTDQYFFDTRSARPNAGFVTDGGARQVSTSVYNQLSFQNRHIQAVGGVTGYAQIVTAAQIGDLLMNEVDGALQQMTWMTEWASCWGNNNSTTNQPYPQFDGFDTAVTQFVASNTVSVNSIDAAGGALTLGMLNKLRNIPERKGLPVIGSNWMYLGSSTFVSKVAELLTQTQQRIVAPTVTLPDSGLIVEGYRNVPLVMSSFLGANGYTMSTVSGSAVVVGGGLTGTLPAGTYKYQVAALVGLQGESIPCAEVSVTVGGSGTTGIALSFTPPSNNPEGGIVLSYKVFRTLVGGATATEFLLGYVDAVVGVDGNNNPITTNLIIDTGTALVPENASGPTLPAVPPAAYSGVAANYAGHFPRQAGTDGSGTEDVFFVSRDPRYVLRPWVRQGEILPVAPTIQQPDTLPFAVATDTMLAWKASIFLARLRNVDMAL
jgi:hypothetical protein